MCLFFYSCKKQNFSNLNEVSFSLQVKYVHLIQVIPGELISVRSHSTFRSLERNRVLFILNFISCEMKAFELWKIQVNITSNWWDDKVVSSKSEYTDTVGNVSQLKCSSRVLKGLKGKAFFRSSIKNHPLLVGRERLKFSTSTPTNRWYWLYLF